MTLRRTAVPSCLNIEREVKRIPRSCLLFSLCSSFSKTNARVNRVFPRLYHLHEKGSTPVKKASFVVEDTTPSIRGQCKMSHLSRFLSNDLRVGVFSQQTRPAN